jgi:hypothetical protein
MQVCGGAGYTKDWSIEQYLRDVRIALIYEGTNHIQALDLVGRKLPRHGGRLFQTFAKEAGKLAAEAQTKDETKAFGEALNQALATLTETTMGLGAKAMADNEEAGAAASTYLNLFGLVACAYSWTRQALHAVKADTPNKATKLKTANYFFKMVLPEMDSLVRIIAEGKAHMMSFEVDEL